MSDLRKALADLLQYLDDHDWGLIPEGATADHAREALSAPPEGREQGDWATAEADIAALASRMRKGMVASAGFVRDSKNPDAIRDMQDAINCLDELLDLARSAVRALASPQEKTDV